ncbi:SCAN domain-containing protein 3 [Trichonephila clavipes]|uniref:SCAN domain-containing protein 3 n=1 Tax=Trichonephila clavipes TaxID=2585209 RepID=A0A8X6RQM9_TRICX|nr:SCAN domain-containing protein 3 [Trichonephila clavipes]
MCGADRYFQATPIILLLMLANALSVLGACQTLDVAGADAMRTWYEALDFIHRSQVDLVDLQSTPDRNYIWLLHYQDRAYLRPLTSKRATEVALELLKIFLEVDCPRILQRDNGREFTAAVIQELKSLWSTCRLINGRPRHPVIQGSIERSNQDIEAMLRCNV